MIREATLEDVPGLLAMGKRFRAGSAYEDLLSIDDATVSNTLHALITAPVGIVLVLEIEGQLKGAILGQVATHFVSGLPTLVEMSWWVDPDARGQGARLLLEFERVGKDAGAVAASVAEPPENEMVGRLYERRGYRKVETTYMKVL